MPNRSLAIRWGVDALAWVASSWWAKVVLASVFSGFNQPDDISMDNKFDTLCGITEEELENYFHAQILELADSNSYSYEEMTKVLQQRFDGYHFGPRMKGVYNPFSILNTFFKMMIRDYWFRTGTPTYLVRLLQDNHENLNELTGKYYDEREFVDYRADKEKTATYDISERLSYHQGL